MMKLEIEIPEVEKGSLRCGKCPWCMASTYDYRCALFHKDNARTALDNVYSPMRCRECLGSELEPEDKAVVRDGGKLAKEKG
jgi:hypothetical protein